VLTALETAFVIFLLGAFVVALADLLIRIHTEPLTKRRKKK